MRVSNILVTMTAIFMTFVVIPAGLFGSIESMLSAQASANVMLVITLFALKREEKTENNTNDNKF